MTDLRCNHWLLAVLLLPVALIIALASMRRELREWVYSWLVSRLSR